MVCRIMYSCVFVGRGDLLGGKGVVLWFFDV